MADIDVGTVETVDPGRFWKSESEYIDWVTDNLDRLGEALELEFFDVQQGVKLGEHVVDIVAEADGVGRAVIECKLGNGDHESRGAVTGLRRRIRRSRSGSDRSVARRGLSGGSRLAQSGRKGRRGGLGSRVSDRAHRGF